MSEIIEFLLENYIWILSIIIVILLAIIGYFADKTNFGQKDFKLNDDIKETNTQEDLLNGIDTNKTLKEAAESLTESNKEEVKEDKHEVEVEKQPVAMENNPEANLKEELKSEIEEKKLDGVLETSEDENINLDQMFNEVIPVKSLMDDEILDDIDNMTVEPTSLETKDIPDLDDIELPKIESLATDTEEDIWRF